MSLKPPRRVLVLGSGPLQIGQAGEFDYSGSQALKALREHQIETVLLNPNIATVQTSEELADRVYLLPIDAYFAEAVLEKERVDGILLAFGGQTALNCGLDLAERGVLARLGVNVLGTPIESIRATEDRGLFIDQMRSIGVKTAKSRVAHTLAEAIAAARSLGFPVILRAGYSLGGKGSSIVRTEEALEAGARRALAASTQVLVEECLSGWKEIEYEVMRDAGGNVITVCNMENVDPMGVHTGESIVVAPSQTLSDEEYQLLRDTSIRIASHLGIVGECNVQFALDPKSLEYRVIEVNARLSRSSALASKATGYPLAYIAAKIALGHSLPELKNAVTRTTSAFFEPAMDYIVCKIPRWDFEKFEGVDAVLGTEMQSVGEVMAIGRSFPEALQKALRMLDQGAEGIEPDLVPDVDLERALERPSPTRIHAIARACQQGMPTDVIASLSGIDPFFIAQVAEVEHLRIELARGRALDAGLLLAAKRAGFSDLAIARARGVLETSVREFRHKYGVRPKLARIDTVAGEYPAETNYTYLTYHADRNEVVGSDAKQLLVLGSGCYRIGSSVEFDWCCVEAVRTARELGYKTILLNCNPETVSTDYDVCDVLVFDELSLEVVAELHDTLTLSGVVVSMGGQTPNRLAPKLAKLGLPLLGTDSDSIDRAEDRKKFSALCDALAVDQPRWVEAGEVVALASLVEGLGGYPVVVRPSYVLSGAAMRVAHGVDELTAYLENAARVSREHPVVLSKFEQDAREIEFDGVAENGVVHTWAICEHVENAGVHSGDATLLLPPQTLYLKTIQQARKVAGSLAQALRITGPFNVQFLAVHGDVKVIECNVRASRSFPFVSKTLGVNFAAHATRALLGDRLPDTDIDPLSLPFVAVKASQFSHRRLAGADPVLAIEMTSTGEVGTFGDDAEEALLKALLATGFRFPEKGVLLSLGPPGLKYRFTDEARFLSSIGLRLFATVGTASLLSNEGIECTVVDKGEEIDSTAIRYMTQGDVDWVINIPVRWDAVGRPDGYFIRRAALELEIPLMTDPALARHAIRAIRKHTRDALKVLPIRAYRERN